mgnify:CR=1 FL=1
MSIEHVGRLIVSEGEWSTAEKLVLIVLAEIHRSDREDDVWPSLALIARRASMTTRGVQKVLRALEERGAIQTVARAHPDGRQTSNLYRLRFGGGVNSVQGEGELSSGAGVN